MGKGPSTKKEGLPLAREVSTVVSGGPTGAPCCGAGGWLFERESSGSRRAPAEYTESKMSPPTEKESSMWRKMMSSKRVVEGDVDVSSTSSALEQLRTENPETNSYTILAWWHASETSARAREAEKATNLAEAARAARRARASSGKVAALLDHPDLGRELDPADVKAVEALALTAAVDAETADRHAMRWANPQSSHEDIVKAPASIRRGAMTFYGSDDLLPTATRNAAAKDSKALREDATRLAEKTRRNLERVLKTNDSHLADRLAADMRATARLFHDLLAAAGARDVDLRVFVVSCALRATADATKAERYVEQRFQITHADNDYVTVFAAGDDDRARVVAKPASSSAAKAPPRDDDRLKPRRATLAKRVALCAVAGLGLLAAALALTFPCLPRWQLAQQRVNLKNHRLNLEFIAAVSTPGVLPYAVTDATFVAKKQRGATHKGLVDDYDSRTNTVYVQVELPVQRGLEHSVAASVNTILDRTDGPTVDVDVTLDATLRLLYLLPLPLHATCKHSVKMTRPAPAVQRAKCAYRLFHPRNPLYRTDEWTA
mmetsp:Transcript_18011/g.56505  ORF Transcript_18011/g.56505 Transcript_18011/m.56505 type:complete len:549 (+) Transcript_18011:73-1719(+)